MDTSKIRKMFILDEGMRTKPYRCTAGKLSVGLGRNLDDVGISEDEAYYLLNNDVERATRACVAIFGKGLWDRWSENRKLGWLNLAFNLGQVRLLNFRNTLRATLREDWPSVEKGLRASLWFKQVGSRAERVIAMIVREEFPYA
jgi:lysozyme